MDRVKKRTHLWISHDMASLTFAPREGRDEALWYAAERKMGLRHYKRDRPPTEVTTTTRAANFNVNCWQSSMKYALH